MTRMRLRDGTCLLVLTLVSLDCACAQAPRRADVVQFVVTSDVHFGITRRTFRGDTGVRSLAVNTAMIAQMTRLPELQLPGDAGVHAGRRVGAIDFVAITGDIANRADSGVQSARASWREFAGTYLHQLHLRDGSGRPSHLYVVPGNHDISNAIGFTRPMNPSHDASSAAGIYNLEMHPGTRLTAEAYDLRRHRVHYSVDLRGVHFAFLNLWPDSVERRWLDANLARVPASTPVLLFTHDPPIGDARHFVNPNGAHDLNTTDRFENLLSDFYEASALPASGTPKEAETVSAQRKLAAFVREHTNIKAYFHGHANFNEFYEWSGPDKNVILPTFRVDSPMKGAVSASDESQLSFQLVTIDSRARRMTVRECFWNNPSDRTATPRFGTSRTITLR